MSICELKTGVRYPIPGNDEVVEFACPHCYYVWLGYGSAEDYPQYCPGCGRDLDLPDHDADSN